MKQHITTEQFLQVHPTKHRGFGKWLLENIYWSLPAARDSTESDFINVEADRFTLNGADILLPTMEQLRTYLICQGLLTYDPIMFLTRGMWQVRLASSDFKIECCKTELVDALWEIVLLADRIIMQKEETGKVEKTWEQKIDELEDTCEESAPELSSGVEYPESMWEYDPDKLKVMIRGEIRAAKIEVLNRLKANYKCKFSKTDPMLSTLVDSEIDNMIDQLEKEKLAGIDIMTDAAQSLAKAILPAVIRNGTL